jgi:molybdopterin-guanine dinucleotide biosynthesis protein A
MEKLVQELEKILDDFRVMQEAHKKALETPGTCDFETMTFERSRVFSDLKEQLSLVLRTIRGRPGGTAFVIAPSCRSRLADILEAEQRLMDQVSEQRSHLAVQMEKLAGLRRGLKGYARSSSKGITLSPSSRKI